MEPFEQKLIDFIGYESLFEQDDPILIAVSGGADSVVLVHILHTLRYRVAIAHCNFQLRGNESDQDAEFVKAISEELEVPFYENSFDTKSYATARRESVQMAARSLRYQWMHELLMSEGFNYLITAHHATDLAETILLNQLRGTGIRGYSGILPKSGKLVRPLLFARKEEILNYAVKKAIRFREDSSNLSTKYDRNYLRLQVLPELRSLNPSLEETFFNNARRAQIARRIFENAIAEKKNACTYQKDQVLWINIEKLRQIEDFPMYLYEWLKSFGFRYSQLNEVLKTLNVQPGRKVRSKSHTLYKDRSYLLVVPEEYSIRDLPPVEIKGEDTRIRHGDLLIELKYMRSEHAEPLQQIRHVALDPFKLQFPLVVRTWEKGDFFYPAGFGRKKKISDFLTDMKLPLPEKNRVRVLLSNNSIAWVVGFRADERFTLKEKSKNALMIACSFGDTTTS